MCDESEASNNEKMKKKLSDSEIIDATFKHLARINGEINRMNSNQLIERLKYYGLNTEGNDDLRRRRLKNNYRSIKLASININICDKLLPYYVIIDFEATCIDVNTPDFQHEIIEFPAVLVNSTTQVIEDTFQMYCKPSINPQLTDFCKELTGITQEQVDSGQSFERVLQSFQTWLDNHNLGQKYKFAVVTDSHCDMTKFLFQQCHYSNVTFPKWGKKWVNLKRSFFNFYKCKWSPLKNMLHYLGMEFEGRLHCGLDDAKNIARILIRMMCDGANIQPNEKITTNAIHMRNKSNNFKSGKTDVNSVDNNSSGRSRLNEKSENLKVQAYFIIIRNKDQISTYERIKKRRGKLKAKIEREIRQKCDDMESVDALGEMLEWLPSQLTRNKEK